MVSYMNLGMDKFDKHNLRLKTNRIDVSLIGYGLTVVTVF